ncbi:MAG: rRNA methyltransferase [Firmicutes bacterium]|nr:rRNA methyltransferase [Bacillota bacterium]
MDLPTDLRTAVEQELETMSSWQLTKGVASLSDRYRHPPRADGLRFVQSAKDAAAYIAFRLPATYAAVYFALRQVQAQFPDWSPHTLLDVGAGPGTVMWAAAHADLWSDSLEQVTLLEREANMINMGKRLAGYAIHPAVREAKWRSMDITQPWGTPVHDLVVTSYVLGELPLDSRAAFLGQLWEMTNHSLVIIEPGTPRGFEHIREARERLLGLGGKMVAPCPHDRPCPMEHDDWCHFAQRVARSRLHRQTKGGELGYEDEKFSFVGMARLAGRGIRGRIVRHPQVRKGHVRLQLCTPDGLTGMVITRRNRDLYRRARKVEWGDSFEY